MITTLLCLVLAVGCGPDAKQSIAPDLIVFAGDAPIHSDRIELPVTILNWGAAPSSSSQLLVYINERPNWRDSTTSTLLERDIPALDPKSSTAVTVEIVLDELEPDSDYYLLIQVGSVDGELNPNNWDVSGFSLNEDKQVVVKCDPLAPHDVDEGETDPLFGEQWHLENTGRQRRYWSVAGVAGEDLGMLNVLSAGTPTGDGIRIAIVDTGMQTCHPDLADNVEDGASYNFNANEWHNSDSTEPYLPSTMGDHGTSVAGTAAAAADNGTGGRGVAPGRDSAWLQHASRGGVRWYLFRFPGR